MSRIDQWPNDLFVVLAMLGQIQEALERIELCSNPEHQINLWGSLIQYYDTYQRKATLVRVQQVALGIPLFNRIKTLISVANTAISLNDIPYASPLIEQAISSSYCLVNDLERSEAFRVIAITLVNIDDLNRSFQIAQSIDSPWKNEDLLVTIAIAAGNKNNIDYALQIIQSIDSPLKRSKAYASLSITASTLGQFKYINRLIILASAPVQYTDNKSQAEILATLATSAAALGHINQANELIAQAITSAYTIKDRKNCSKIFMSIATSAAALGHINQANELIAQVSVYDFGTGIR